MNKDVNDYEFISMMQLWMHKNGTHPLELITFFSAKNGEKIIAIPDYGSFVDQYLLLAENTYTNYQSALTKVGALMDEMDYPKALNTYKAGHPLSCKAFHDGYNSEDDINPYDDETDKNEWENGKEFRLSQLKV